MREDIIKIMKKVFKMDENAQLLDTDTQANILEWDSLAQVALVTELEDFFDVKFDFMDLISMDSAIEIEKVILEKKASVEEN